MRLWRHMSLTWIRTWWYNNRHMSLTWICTRWYGRSYKSFIFLLHQTPFQRLTLRMTRFYTSQPSAKVWNRLQHVMRNMGYDARTSADKVGIQTTMATIARFNHTYIGFMNNATWSSGNRYSQGSLITVVSRKYAPPFATLALVQNAGGLICSMQHFLSQLRPPFRLSKAWPHCRWGVHPSARLWQASVVRGKKAGHFHEVAGMSIVDAGGPSLMRAVLVCGRHFNGRQPIGLNKSRKWVFFLGGGYVRDKNTSARLCAKNAGGGGLCVRGGIFVGHYGTCIWCTVLPQEQLVPIPEQALSSPPSSHFGSTVYM